MRQGVARVIHMEGFPIEFCTGKRQHAGMRRLGAALWVALSLPVCAAELASDAYVRAFDLLRQGDQQALVDPLLALESYLKAEQGLARLQQNYPNWNSKTVAEQLGRVQAKIEPLKRKFGIPQPDVAKTDRTPRPVLNAVEFNRRLEQLRAEQKRRDEEFRMKVVALEKSEEGLKERLKEAIGARGRELDPGELAKAEERNRKLNAELAYLQAHFARGKEYLQQMKTVLDAERKNNVALQKQLAEQAEGKALEQVRKENQQLLQRIKDLSGKAQTAGDVEDLRRQVQLLQRQLAAQTARANQLAEDKRKLERLLNEAP